MNRPMFPSWRWPYRLAFVFVAVAYLCSLPLQTQAASWSELTSLWEKFAPYCRDTVRQIRFPSKERCEEDERDGDMVLFGGLLCGTTQEHQ